MKNHVKIILIIVLLTGSLMTNYHITRVANDYQSTPGTVDGISVTAIKTVSTYTTHWAATVRSTAASSINRVGASWWTVEQRCTDAQATYSYWKQKNYQGNSGSNYEDGYFISTIDYPCPSGSYILHSASKGNHEFIGPYSTIYIYEEATVLGW